MTAPSILRDQSVRAALKRLLEEPPKLHRPKDFNPADDPAAEDGLVSWGIQTSFLELLAKIVVPGSLTLETGCGLSTICLAIIGSEHICVSPFEKEHNRIRNYCSDHQISIERVRFIPKRSHVVLPSLDTGGRKLDFALIDGSHTFPEPFVDYFYVNDYLKVGGVLAVDDLNISGVGILHKFLVTDPNYKLLKFDGLKTGIYRKVADTCYPRGWPDQSFNSKYPDFSYLPVQTRLRQKLGPVEMMLRNGLGRVPGVRRAYHLFRTASNKAQ